MNKISKEVRCLLRAVEKKGWTWKMTSTGHIRVLPPKEVYEEAIVLPSKVGDYRGIKNVTSILRRAGLDV